MAHDLPKVTHASSEGLALDQLLGTAPRICGVRGVVVTLRDAPISDKLISRYQAPGNGEGLLHLHVKPIHGIPGPALNYLASLPALERCFLLCS